LFLFLFLFLFLCCLGDQGRGSRRLVLPGRRESLGLLVVAGKLVDTRLDENQTELGVLVLAVLLKMLADVHSLLDKEVEILWELRGKTGDLEDTKDLVTSDRHNLWDSHGVSQQNTDLRRGHTLLGVLDDLVLDNLSVDLAPARSSAAVWKGRAGDTLAIKWQ
jgi:hypothetical protein